MLGGGGGGIPKGYNGYSITQEVDGKWYHQALLHRDRNVTYPVTPDPDTNPEFDDLRMRASMMNDHTVRFRVNPISNTLNEEGEVQEIKRWELPQELLGTTKDDYGMRLIWANFETNKDPAGLQISNPETKQLYLSTKNRNFAFMDKYIEQGFELDSRHIFGFGERQKTFELNEGEYSSWASGRDNHLDEGKIGGHSYGDHPFVLARLNDNTFVGIFFANSNAKSLEYTHVGKDKSILNFRANGGILDFYTFFAESAEEVIKAYHGVIGVPYLPPFWALGYHQSAWQYNETKAVDEVLSGYDTNDIPLEGLWLDIEYMNDYKNFEVNTTRFKSIPTLSNAMHKKGQKLITIVDAGFAADEEYQYYKEGNGKDLFIKSATSTKHNGNLIGTVWPGLSAFVDFQNPKATDFWINGLTGLHTATDFDGIWIDMNEATSFCDGECPDGPKPEPDEIVKRELSEDEKEEWTPTGEISPEHMSLSLDAKHYGETEEEKKMHTEYNLHSLYGTYEAKATYEYWIRGTKLQGKRPFVLSRSTFAGSGKWTSHWLGDNWSQWDYMKYSVAGIMDFNMFGIPLVGADVCGFHTPYEDEMCGRWTQLSTFYPFARNHYNLTDVDLVPLPPQEPFRLKGEWKETARKAIIQRYSYLRYMYTRLYEINQNGGGTLVRPLFFEFPEDDKAYENYEHSFMVGSFLKVTPVLVPSSEHNGKIKSYFPAGSRFISMNDFSQIIEGGESGVEQELDASMDYTNVHLREGSIIPFQNMTSESFEMRTSGLISKRGITLLAFADKMNNAEGTLYIDENGDDFNDIELDRFQYYKLRFGEQTLSIEKQAGELAQGDTTKGNQILDKFILLNADEFKTSKMIACAYDDDFVPKEVSAVYDESMNAVVISSVGKDILYFKDLLALQFSDATNDKTFCNAKYTIKSVTKLVEPKNDDVTTQVSLTLEGGDSSVLPDLSVTFKLIRDEFLRVTIEDPADPNEFKAPEETFDPDFFAQPHTPTVDIFDILTLPKEGEEFYYEVHNLGKPNQVYYSTKGQRFVYSKYYKRHTALIESTGHLFGLGERVGDLFLEEGVYTIWNRDEPSPIENSQRPGNNIYGTHPIYFSHTSDNNLYFAVFDHNVGAQDYLIRKVNKKYEITSIKTSGITDQYILLKDSISHVVGKFQDMIGLPAMVPEWGLGWHQCRYGYNNTAQANEVVEKFYENNIPLDVMWTDIDYMEQYRDFTLSESDFEDLPEAIATWKEKYGLKYIPILDAGLAYQPGVKDSPYERGKAKDVYIKDANDESKPFVGKVWPGPAVYIDWLKEGSEDFWVDEMTKLHEKLPFDGMWIDMNEASNFCDGFCTKDQIVEDSIQNKLIYTPGARDLNKKSISIDALHHDGVTEFEAHSTYGFYMSKATSRFFTETQQQRQFVITRSTYSGVGKYVSHWLGDNFATWDMLKLSINGVYLFQMYGVPIAGADICGFIDDTNAELCARWYAVGAFYPFARNHNDKNAISQEPYVDMFGVSIAGLKDKTYTDFFREAALKRYALHRYHYTHVHEASRTGNPYFTPLFFRYPEDKEAYSRPENNIMLGKSVKVSAVLSKVLTTTTFYFPEKDSLWCPIWPKYTTKCFPGKTKQLIKVPEDEMLVHIKSGSAILTQLGSDPTSAPQGLTIEGLRDHPSNLLIHADKKYTAFGNAIFDDGETQDLEAYTEFEFHAKGSNPFLGSGSLDIEVKVIKEDSTLKDSNNQNMGSLVIYHTGLFSFGAKSKAVITTRNGQTIEMSGEYDKTLDMSRFSSPKAEGTPFKEIQNIHVSAK